MGNDLSWQAALWAATAAHAAFQLTVTGLVYPALAEVPAERWPAAHRRHSGRIVPLVGAIYLAVVASLAGLLGIAPSAAGMVAGAASAGAFLVTATVAAPLHRSLGGGRDQGRLDRLLRADRLRCVLAVLACLAGGYGVLTGS